MNPPDNEHDPQIAPTAVRATPVVPTRCDECGAPVDEEQRYCVVCGAHRRHVEDPASRYLSGLSARARTTRVTTVARTGRRSQGRGRGLGLAVALALVPVAAAVGVVAERGADNGDAKLIQALAREQAAATAADAGSSRSGAAPGAAASADAGSGTHSRRTSRVKDHSRKKGAPRTHARAHASSSIPGGVAISTSPPSRAQKQEGAKVTQKVQKSTGKNYVSGQQGLPSTVVVP